MQKDHGQHRRHFIECKHITYDSYKLKKIRHDSVKDIRYKQLPFGTVKLIRELILYRRKRGSRGGISNKDDDYLEKSKGINWYNLMRITYTINNRVRHNGKLCQMVLNTQLIRKKKIY